MKGTEKQIKWAEEIKAATLQTIDELISEGQKYKGSPKADAILETFAAQREAIENCEYAGDMIECFRSIRGDDTHEQRCGAFNSACRVTYANNPAQEQMLGKEAWRTIRRMK